MAIVNIETKGNNIAILARFLVYEVHEADAQIFIMKVVKLVKATNTLHVNSRENMWQTILKESNNYLFELIFNNDIEKFEYYEKSVVQRLVFDVLMRVVREIFKYDNAFFYFYPTSRNCGSENFNTWFLQKVLW